MIRRTFAVICGIALLLSAPVFGQFGVPQRRKAGTTFEEINEMAKQQFQAGEGNSNAAADLDDLSNLDMDQMQEMIKEAMQDPNLMEAMNSLNDGVENAMSDISQMDPVALKAQMQEGLAMLTSGDMIQTIMGKKEEVLQTLKEQGLVDDETLEEYRQSPEKFEEEMRSAFSQMKDIFANEENLAAATEMMKGMADLLSDPEKAMKELAEVFQNELSDDTKIEEARLALLEDPSNAGNPSLAAAFENEEMQEILKDPIKWREQVKKGQEMLLGQQEEEDGAATTGASMGEL